jgi:hypothetical protein
VCHDRAEEGEKSSSRADTTDDADDDSSDDDGKMKKKKGNEGECVRVWPALTCDAYTDDEAAKGKKAITPRTDSNDNADGKKKKRPATEADDDNVQVCVYVCLRACVIAVVHVWWIMQ